MKDDPCHQRLFSAEHRFEPRYDRRFSDSGFKVDRGTPELVESMKETIYVRDVCRYCGATIEREGRK